MPAKPKPPPDPDRRARYLSGHRAEWLAITWLVIRGYRILARRHKTPFGEIDIIARRGRRLAFIEVKYRATRADADAALTNRQSSRIHRAASHFISQHQRYHALDQHFDAILIVPRTRPVHLYDALAPVGTSGRMY